MDFRFVCLHGHTQSGSIASPLQMMTQHTPMALGAPEMHQTHQELIKRQENNNKPERKYQELFPGTPVWVQHISKMLHRNQQ